MTAPDDIPDTMLLPTVSVFADGVWVADGRDPDTDEPQALDGLVIRWGRTTVVDQPQPSTCSLTLIDRAGGTRFLDLLQLGGRLDVRADALITTTPDPGTGTGQVVIDAEFESGPGDAFVQPGGSAALGTAAGQGTTGAALSVSTLTDQAALVVLPPGPRQPVGGDPTAWDHIPRAVSGETWALSADVKLPAPFAGWTGWAAELVPVTFETPWAVPQLLPLADAASQPVSGGYSRMTGTCLPPQGSWVGVAVRFWPIGPAWDDLPGGTATRHNQANDPRATTGRWRSAGAGVGGVVASSFVATGGPTSQGGPASFYRKTWTTGTTGSTPSAQTGDAVYWDGGNTLFPMTPGKTYTLSCWMRHSSAKAKTYQILAYLYDAGGALVRYPLVNAPSFPINTWIRNSVTFTVQAGEVGMRVSLSMPSGVNTQEWAAGETLDATGLLIEEAPAPTLAYFDGDTAGAAWDGAAGLSTSTLSTSTATAWDDLPGGSGTITNLATNPTPASTTGWSPNVGAQHVHRYNATEQCVDVDRQAAAGANIAASWYNLGNLLPYNPVLPAGVEYQRSIDIWVDQAATLNNTGLTGGFTTTALPANTWTTVVQRFTGTGAAYGAMQGRVEIPGVGTGVHVKLRRAMLVAVPADGQPVAYFDGSTPDTAAWDHAWTGTANASTSTATGIGTAVTWDDLGRMLLDRVRLNAPAAGALRQGMVFSGRVTDLEARFDETERATIVDVTAADQRAELGSRDVGDQPWAAEALGSRFQRIITASGQPIQARVSDTASAYQVSWRDVDRQPAIVLLSELATTADGVLWAATHPTTGPYLQLESLADREALYALVRQTSGDGLVHIVARPVGDTGAVDLSACDVLLDPVRWRHDIEDMATRVVLTWREQTTNTEGQPAPTDRTVTSTNGPLEQLIGTHRVAVSTQLTSEADAVVIADAILGRTGNVAWRVHGLTWRADTTDQLDADALARMMTLLDGTTRNGLPLLLTDLPDWSPVPDVRADVPLFLEGGSYSSVDGAWVLDLVVSSAAAVGQTAAWDDLPGLVTVARRNHATNPRALSTGAAGWLGTRGFGSGGTGTYSYYTPSSKPPPPSVTTVRRKTWTAAPTSNLDSGFQVQGDATTAIPVSGAGGKSVTVSAYLRNSSGTAKNYRMTVQPLSSLAGGVISTEFGPVVAAPTDGSWARISHTFTMPANGVGLLVFPDVATGGTLWANGQTLDCSALLIEVAGTLGVYFDGATTSGGDPTVGFAWEGTADASSSVQNTQDADSWTWDDMADDIRWVDLGGVTVP